MEHSAKNFRRMSFFDENAMQFISLVCFIFTSSAYNKKRRTDRAAFFVVL